MKPFKKMMFTLLVSYAIVMAVNLVSNYGYYAAGNDWRFSVFFTLGVTTLGVVAGTLLFQLVFKNYNWLKKPTLKLLSAVLIFAAFGVLMMVVAIKAMDVILHLNYSASGDYIPNIVYSVLFSVIIGLIMSGRAFLIQLKKSIEDNERIKQEMIQSQYETLKNQVNPHFLFNSLNTLTVMIPQQPDVAVRFVEQMARVFRYTLQHGNEHTVTLDTELAVVRSYLFLNEQRFDGKLKVDIRISEDALRKNIVTQSLLMLVENAIKHNEISSERPLSIAVSDDGNYLMVSNTLQRRSTPEHSTKVGLENITKRYALSSGLPVLVTEANNLFTVKIPLLK